MTGAAVSQPAPSPGSAPSEGVAEPMAFSARNGLAYGLLGLPLAFVALPLYVILPNHYAREFGMPLALLGAILLGARLFDALIDPLLGRLSDRLFARSAASVLRLGALAVAALALTYAAYSAPSIAPQDWCDTLSAL